MRITVNGATQDVRDDLSVADLITDLGHPDRGVAVAVQEVVVPKGEWASTLLHPDSRVEILTAVQGG